MQKFLCVHGHFYQPPRENPWLEFVELQDSAAPYHDWNQRIAFECYAPNATARILDGEGRISRITNNYSKINFDFGPTLLAWMQDQTPEIYQAIIAADKLSQERFAGHGSAMAQVYNHLILPLANSRDKHTQVLWGIRDFQYRFGRMPEGMWLAETAADTPTLEVLANLGIKFTVLSPFQAGRVKEIGKRNSRDVNGGQIDPTRPYLVRLPSGKSISVFFYDAPVSQAVAFERLLTSGERLANRLMSAFSDQRHCDQLVHIATDGESYGHHHRHGEMALAYALQLIENNQLARLTNYAEYLAGHPPTHQAHIHEQSAWSCSHGVGRWMRDCGCNSGGHPDWNQGWRTPLRHSLDWLRDQLAPLFEQRARDYVHDAWEARNDYISVILDRHEPNREAYLARHASRELSQAEKVTVWKLMEMQRHAMLMYTSCGWFFDEVSGIESVQVVQYAARAIQLAKELFQKDFEPGFLDLFQGAKSNIPENGDGRFIYKSFVEPAMIDWPKVTAHYGISSVFAQYGEKTRIFSFCFEDEHRELRTSGKTRLGLGRVRVVSEITHESQLMTYAILFLGEHNLTGGVRYFDNLEAYEVMAADLLAAYEIADFPETIRRMDRHFGSTSYSLKSLFKDEQRRILNEILASTQEDLESRFRLVAERYAPLMKFLQNAGAPLPAGLDMVADFVLHGDIRREVEAEPIHFDHLRNLIRDAEQLGTRVLDPEISFVVKNRMERLMEELAGNPGAIERMQVLQELAALVMPLPLGLNLWKVQNTYWEMLQEVYPGYRDRLLGGEIDAAAWLQEFLKLGERLGFTVKHLHVAAPPEVKLAA